MIFFFNDTATTEIYTLSLHDALPIFAARGKELDAEGLHGVLARPLETFGRSEEHTSELQSQSNLVCRLLLEKKKSTTSHTQSRTTTMNRSLMCSDPTAWTYASRGSAL